MSCRPANAEFGRLLQERGMQYPDVALLVPCAERVLYRCVTGRQHLPRVEARLAALFRLSVVELRRRLWGNKREVRHASVAHRIGAA